MTAYGGAIPDKAVMDKDTFADSINPYLNYFNDTFVPEATALQLDVSSNEASAVSAAAAAVAAANFKGTWTNELTAIGESWEYSGVIYGVLVAGTDSPVTTPSNWFALTIAQAIKNTPSGTVSATTVQGAINELDTEKISAVSINAATSQATPLDTDQFGYITETSPGVWELVKMTGTDNKSWLLGYFGTIFSSKNDITDGRIDFWDNGTSQTSSGYGSATMVKSLHSGSTKTTSQQSFTAGQTDVAGNPLYFKRTIVTSAAGASNYVRDEFFVKDVTMLSGTTRTFSFYGKSDSVRNVAIELVQNFGTGGTPSADVTGIGSQLISLGTTWDRKTATVAIPSVSAKTIGSDGVNTSYTKVIIWYEAGSDFNTRTASLGQQSGTFDIAMLQLQEGDSASEHEQRGRYYVDEVYQTFSIGTVTSVAAGVVVGGYHSFRREMKSIPVVTPFASELSNGFDAAAATIAYITPKGFSHTKATTASISGQAYIQTTSADARF